MLTNQNVFIENLGMNLSDVDFKHASFMEQALQLARRGLYTTMPNPRVGCVLVKDDIVIGQGWHEIAGSGHAEVNALANTKQSAQGATAYVTLEPCSHFGKTPPCCDLLIKAGVATVVVAMIDPNPAVAGDGIKRLEAAGISVITGVLSEAARKINPGFVKRMEVGLPYIRCKMAMSLDARTSMASGESQWITGSEAREKVQRLRAQSCAVVTGIGSILQDDSSLTVRESELGDLEGEASAADIVVHQPLRVVVDSNLRIPLDAGILSQKGCTVIASAVRKPVVENELKQRWQVDCIHLPGADGKVDLEGLMRYLGRRQCNEVLIEAGPNIAGSFLQHGLIDEFQFYMASSLMGSEARGLFELPLKSMKDRIQLCINNIYSVGNDWCIEAVPVMMKER